MKLNTLLAHGGDEHSGMGHMETISIDHDALEIIVADADDVMDILSYLDITLVESPDSSDFIVEYESVAGDDYHSTYVRGVEEIVITTQPEEYSIIYLIVMATVKTQMFRVPLPMRMTI